MSNALSLVTNISRTAKWLLGLLGVAIVWFLHYALEDEIYSHITRALHQYTGISEANIIAVVATYLGPLAVVVVGFVLVYLYGHSHGQRDLTSDPGIDRTLEERRIAAQETQNRLLREQISQQRMDNNPIVKSLRSAQERSFSGAKAKLSILIGNGGHYEKIENNNIYNVTKEMAISVKNTGAIFLSNCKLHYEVPDSKTGGFTKWLRQDSFSLNAGEERYISLASYNEPTSPTTKGGDWIQLHAPPPGGYDGAQPRLPIEGGAVTLVATSAESRPCSAVCRFWVQDGSFHWSKA